MIIGFTFLTALIIVTSINFKYKMRKELTEADKDIILDHIANHALCEPEDLHPETRFENDLTMDSLDRIELIMQIEREFNIMISDSDIEACKNIGQLFNLVSERI